MIQVNRKEDCCGCTACANVCNHNAIRMQPDSLGFLYPAVDKSLCINCGLCDSVCAFQNGYDKSLNLNTPFVYAVRHKDIKEVETSRSGAMFIAISDEILNNGGVVYGAGYKDHFKVAHKRAKTVNERNEFKGSKYVQSDLGNVFCQIKEDLKNGLTVLFSGTPCQTAGLKEFIGKRQRPSLVLVDIVCHGVPSPYIWRDYLFYIEKKYHENIVKVNFRDKSIGWTGHQESFVFESGKKILKKTYTDLFYKHIMLRPSCGTCKYTNTVRPSDITLADYWGWQKVDPNFNLDNKGCSLVFINTEKGQSIWNKINMNLNYLQTDLSKCMQPNLENPSVLSKHSDCFEKKFLEKDFEHAARRYGDIGWRYKLAQQKKRMKNTLKQIIGK